MKPQELRIGNYVRYHHNGGFVEAPIFHLTDEDVNVLPIELTPEILEKAGFVFKNGYGYKHQKLKAILTKVADSIGFHVRTTDFTLEYQYLHQLQNLYFALTGEELDITL